MTDFSYSGKIVYDTISSSGNYELTADGAQGGTGTTGGPHKGTGGKGAAISGDIYLTSGTVLEIVVGEEGGTAPYGGGGGGSFVFETFSGTAALTPILIAGGGGGGGIRSSYGNDDGGPGNTGPTGGNGAPGQAGGTDGKPGVGAAGGGGGYTGGNGAIGSGAGSGETLEISFAGGTGKGPLYSPTTAAGGGASGGFGGGGGGGKDGGGGGGGGYGGGGGGASGGAGGGGGSYDADLTSVSATAGANTGNGEVSVDFLNSLCYLHGTRILTPAGAVVVEALEIGDAVVTRFGGFQRIKWLGRQNFAPAFLANNPEKWPVCIKAGALADGVPARDLYVSPGHSLLLGDVLVLASNLVNGVTVVQTRPERDVHYVQIELEGHDCVAAEGAWAETFADGPGLRAQFHNAAEFDALYPDAAPVEALRLCAPRPERGGRLETALRPVVARAGVAPGRLEGWLETVGDWRIAGWARDLAHPELPVLLEFCVGGEVIGTALAREFRKDLLKAGKGSGRCAFRFTPPARLGAAALETLVVRRAEDGAALPGTERWRRVA